MGLSWVDDHAVVGHQHAVVNAVLSSVLGAVVDVEEKAARLRRITHDAREALLVVVEVDIGELVAHGVLGPVRPADDDLPRPPSDHGAAVVGECMSRGVGGIGHVFRVDVELVRKVSVQLRVSDARRDG